MPSVFFEVPVFYSNPNPGSHLRRVFSASNKAPAGQQAKKAAGAVVFISAMPDRAGSRTVLKAWLVRQSSASNPGSSSSFSRASIEVRASKGSEGLAKLGILELVHGFSVKIAASVNVLSLYSPSEGKIWVMAAKLRDEQGTSKLKGEGLEPRNLDNGVRVWPLRPLVKGKQKKTVHDSVSMYERSVDPCTSPQLLRNTPFISSLAVGALQPRSSGARGETYTSTPQVSFSSSDLEAQGTVVSAGEQLAARGSNPVIQCP